MTKDINYPEFVGGNVTVEQAEKIRKSGLTNSEFIRKAIDFYDETRLSSYTTQKINHVEECIGILKVYQQNLKNESFNKLKIFDENLKSEENMNELVYKETNETFKKSEENLKDETNLKGQTFKKSNENLKGQEIQNDSDDFEPIIDTLARLIANKGHLSKDDYSYQAGRVQKTTAQLKKYMRENYDMIEKEANKYR